MTAEDDLAPTRLSAPPPQDGPDTEFVDGQATVLSPPHQPDTPPGTGAYEPEPTMYEAPPEPAAPSARRFLARGGAGDTKKASRSAFLKELPFLIILGLAIVVLVRGFLLQTFYIPSGSMERTLLCDDHVLVNRLAYRFGGPERGDVIVFNVWSYATDVEGKGIGGYLLSGLRQGMPWFDSGNGREDDLIKRVIGLPGDVVEVRSEDGVSRAYINGKALDEPYVYMDGTDRLAPFGPVKVPKGHYFVLGDHRNDSQDSRHVSGGIFVDKDAIVGEAFVKIWPLSRINGLQGDNPPEGPIPAC